MAQAARLDLKQFVACVESPLPACGEKSASVASRVRGISRWPCLAANPPHPDRLARARRSDLSPQAGRGGAAALAVHQNHWEMRPSP
jgi:hypothetical protein